MQGFQHNLHFVHRFYLRQTGYFKKAKKRYGYFKITCTQLIKLLDRSIVAYVVEGDELSAPHIFSNKKKEQTEDLLTSREQEIAKWVYENKQRAGATTERF